MQSPVPGLRAAAAQTQDAGLNWAEVKGAGVPAELVDSAPSGVALMKVASGWDISLWRRGFHPWPGNFRMPRGQPKKKQKTKKAGLGNVDFVFYFLFCLGQAHSTWMFPG